MFESLVIEIIFIPCTVQYGSTRNEMFGVIKSCVKSCPLTIYHSLSTCKTLGLPPKFVQFVKDTCYNPAP